MKYYATVGERVFEISVDRHGVIVIDGEEIAVDMRAVGGGGLYSLLLNNLSHDVVVEVESDSRSLYGVMVSGERYLVKVQDERSRRLALADRTVKATSGELALKAPIPGLVVRVLVAPGQQVAEGETLIILEAMKMENELRAPRAGVIHEVRTDMGAQVAHGQVLITMR